MSKLESPIIYMTKELWEKALREFPVINCGPAALCAISGRPLIESLRAIPKFKDRQYTSPTMMKGALESMGITITSDARNIKYGPDDDKHQLTEYGLVRIQFCGPWYGRFAYHHTHWVAAARFPISHGAARTCTWVFDVNNQYGWTHRDIWESSTMPFLLREVKRGDGCWCVTHRWELEV
jgi:hypothetical protein